MHVAVLEAFSCPICKGTLTDPVFNPAVCCHSICSSHLDRFYAGGGERECPVCFKSLGGRRNLVPDAQTEEFLRLTAPSRGADDSDDLPDLSIFALKPPQPIAAIPGAPVVAADSIKSSRKRARDGHKDHTLLNAQTASSVISSRRSPRFQFDVTTAERVAPIATSVPARTRAVATASATDSKDSPVTLFFARHPRETELPALHPRVSSCIVQTCASPTVVRASVCALLNQSVNCVPASRSDPVRLAASDSSRPYSEADIALFCADAVDRGAVGAWRERAHVGSLLSQGAPVRVADSDQDALQIRVYYASRS
jgi:hypothetical protein